MDLVNVRLLWSEGKIFLNFRADISEEIGSDEVWYNPMFVALRCKSTSV